MVVRLILCPCLEGAKSREPAKPASQEDKQKITRLRIPDSFVQGIDPHEKRKLTRQVANQQYQMLLGVTVLRGKRTMPPREAAHVESTSIPARYGAIGACKVNPRPTDKTLWDQVTYKPQKAGMQGYQRSKGPTRTEEHKRRYRQCRHSRSPQGGVLVRRAHARHVPSIFFLPFATRACIPPPLPLTKQSGVPSRRV